MAEKAKKAGKVWPWIADDCIFILNGQLWEQNTTEELFNNLQKQETKDYLQGAYA